MNKVIVTGATGFIGSAFIQFLVNQKVDVLAIGRKDFSKTSFGAKINKSEYFNYLKIELREINTLPDKLEKINWSSDSQTVFYHFAWKGKERLTDGDVADQIANVEFSANAVLAAKSIGCKKFINVGSQEEILAQKYLQTKKWKTEPYPTNMGRYAISKLASKDMCSLVSYLNKIDYIHTRFSVIVDEKNLNSGYITTVFKNILDRNNFEKPQNSQLFDIISINDAVKAFYLIGKNAKNKEEFFIGSGEPKTLEDYFTEFSSLVREVKPFKSKIQEKNQLFNKNDFANDELYRVTGFKPDSNILFRILNEN